MSEVLSRTTDILDAQENGLVSSGQVDIIFTSFPATAAKKLFNEQHRGRVLAMFRHLVDRLISKFYYLQVA